MTKQWLSKTEYLEQGQGLSSGQKIRVNHSSSDCQGNSNSLVIERRDDGSISACCFRCGRRGYHSDKSAIKSKSFGGGVERDESSAGSKYTLPGDGRSDTKEWPIEAVHWLRKYGITDTEILDYGILYSECLRRVVLPVFATDGSLASFQSRRIFEGDPAPKYLTFFNDNCPFVSNNHFGKSLVICEDYLSAIRLGRIMPAMALLGVKLQAHHLEYISQMGYTEFLVFLDDDNMQVKRAQLEIKRTLDKLGTCTIHHSHGIDPKEYSDAELLSIVL